MLKAQKDFLNKRKPLSAKDFADSIDFQDAHSVDIIDKIRKVIGITYGVPDNLIYIEDCLYGKHYEYCTKFPCWDHIDVIAELEQALNIEFPMELWAALKAITNKTTIGEWTKAIVRYVNQHNLLEDRKRSQGDYH